MSIRAQLAGELKLIRARIGMPLSFASIWPASPELGARAHALAAPSAEGSLAAGEAWLVSAHERSRRSGLWRLHADPEGPFDTTLVEDAAEDARRALERALTGLLIVPTIPSRSARPAWRAQGVCFEDGAVAEPSMRGGSFGLAMILAAASRCLDIPVPSSVLATGEVDADLVVKPVRFIEDKVRFIVDYALGVTTLLVAEAQAAHVRALLAGASLHGRAIEVVGVARVADAISAVFPALEATLRERWREAATAERALDALWDGICRSDRHTGAWRGVARAAHVLGECVSEGARWRAEWVSSIARRHLGEQGTRLSMPPAPARRHGERWVALSQVLQSAADDASDDAVARAYLGETKEYANEYALESPDGRRFLGARARALAAIREEEEAIAALVPLVEAWFGGGDDEVRHASFALSELLRLMGTHGTAAQRERALGWARLYEEKNANLEEPGRDFVRLSLARCLVQRGSAGEALRALEGDILPVLRASRLRWRARGLWQLGRTQDAEAVWTALAQMAPTDAVWARSDALAALDRSLASKEADVPLVLARLCALRDDGPEVLRMFRQRGKTPATCSIADARWIADAFRY